MAWLSFCELLIEIHLSGGFVGSEHVGGVYFSIWRAPAPRKVKKLQFLPFFIEKHYIHRKSQFFGRKSPKFEWI